MISYLPWGKWVSRSKSFLMSWALAPLIPVPYPHTLTHTQTQSPKKGQWLSEGPRSELARTCSPPNQNISLLHVQIQPIVLIWGILQFSGNSYLFNSCLLKIRFRKPIKNISSTISLEMFSMPRSGAYCHTFWGKLSQWKPAIKQPITVFSAKLNSKTDIKYKTIVQTKTSCEN